ncbi:MAG: hypothetical protein H0T05_01810 [Acidobacteria bacterium]|nr:hypothetical protein [Acidobacteriota bacterium]
MSNKTDRESTRYTEATRNEILRAAREYRDRPTGVPGHGKPSGTPRENRPKLRGAPAAEAVIEGRS